MIPQANRPDELVYFDYASRLSFKGVAGLRESFEKYLREEPMRYLPSPVRVASIFFGAAAVKAWGPSFASLHSLSLVFYLALLLFAFFWVDGMAGPGLALATAALVAFSPLQLALAGSALIDQCVALFMTAAFALFVKALLEKAPFGLWSAVVVSYALAFLSRESAVILIPLSFIVLGWAGFSGRRKASVWQWCAVSAFPLLGAGIVLLAFAGNPATLWRVLHLESSSVGSNSYAVLFGSGPWYRYLIDFTLLSPWVVLLYFVYLGTLTRGSRRSLEMIVWPLLPLAAILMMAPFTKNIRYALWLDLPMRFCAVLCVSHIIRVIWGGRNHATAMIAAIFGLCLMDLFTFIKLFLVNSIYDPVTIELLAKQQIVK